MLTEEDVKSYIERSIPMGEKSYVKLWRRDDAIGVIVMVCNQKPTSPANIPTDWWRGLRGIVKVRDSEFKALKQLSDFFRDPTVEVDLPGVMTRGRFEREFRDEVISHHLLLAENLRNRENWDRAVFGFRFWGDIYQHDRLLLAIKEYLAKFKEENPKLPIKLKVRPDGGSVYYGWSSC